MKRLMLAGVAACALAMGGCALFSSGKDAAGNPTPPPIVGVVGAVSTALGFGWVTTLLGAGTTVLAAYKGSGWKSAATSTFAAVEEWKATPEGAKVWEGLKTKLGEHHAAAHVFELVNKALGNK